jgi:hypothetical protein
VFYGCFDRLKCAVDAETRRVAPELNKSFVRRIYGDREIRSHWTGRGDEIVNQRAEEIENNRSDRHGSTHLMGNSVVAVI